MLQIASPARRKGHLVKKYSPARFLRGHKMDMPFIEEHTYWGSKGEFYVHNYVGMLLGEEGGTNTTSRAEYFMKSVRCFFENPVLSYNFALSSQYKIGGHSERIDVFWCIRFGRRYTACCKKYFPNNQKN